MPVAFLRPFGQGGFAPVARPRFVVGSDLDCDLVDTSAGVAEHHGTVRLQRGEYVLVAENGRSLWVRGERVPLISLRDGDEVALAAGARPWRFRSRVEGSFWPPHITVGEAWLAHPDFARTTHGPQRFGDGRPIGERDPGRSHIVLGPHGPLIVKYLGPIQEPKQATRYLRFLTALAGATHPALAPVVDAGLTARDGVAWRWIATRYVDGIDGRQLIASGPLECRRTARILRSLAEGLAHLHHRGILHRNVSLGNVVVPPTDLAVLIDFGMSHSLENADPRSADARPSEAFAAPEVQAGGAAALSLPVDIYALGALGRALLLGDVPSQLEDAAAVRAAVRERDAVAHDALVAVLETALASDPAERPTALEFSASLRFLEGRLGPGTEA